MTRGEFRDSVLARDGYKCVLCGSPADAAHHIMERRLFSDGGYHAENGSAVCEACHWRLESTEVSPGEVREAAGITKVVLPEHLYADQRYTKWGDPVLEDGTRLKGELFDDPSVRKVIAPYLHLYDERVKYPRTHHLPWSAGVTDDDRVMKDFEAAFEGREVVVTAKFDGENTSLYRDHIHARSLDGRSHPSRDWVKNLHSRMAHDIPQGWRVCGENLYAVHQIRYRALASYFLGFSVFDSANHCLSWDETLEWLALLGLAAVPEIYRGPPDPETIHRAWQEYAESTPEGISEGYVARDAGAFHYRQFRERVAKYVRGGFVAGRPHWFYGRRMEVNGLAGES